MAQAKAKQNESYSVLRANIPWSTNMVSERVIFGGVFILFYFGFLSFGSVMNKIVTLLALVRYEMFTAKSALYAQCSLSIISHPTGVHGIIFSN